MKTKYQMNVPLNIGETVRNNSAEYLGYYIRDHYPNAIDGIKVVHRRIILALHNFPNSLKSVDAVGKVNSIHDHSDTSIYGTIVRLSQPWYINPPLVTIEGSNGLYSDSSEAAAPRYTRTVLSQFCNDIFINDIDMTTLRYEIADDLSSTEPSYYIPKIPVALLYSMYNVGYGYTSRGICFSLKDVCNLTVAYIENPDKMKRIYKSLFPYYHGNCVLNFHDVYQNYLDEKFNDGDMQIHLESQIEIGHDNTIIFHTVPYGTSPDMVMLKLLEKIQEKGSWLNENVKEIKNLSDKDNYYDTNIHIKFKSNINIFSAIDKLKMYFTDTVSVYNNFEFHKRMKSFTVKELIEAWYHERSRSVKSELKRQVFNIHKQINRLETFLLISDYTDDVINIIRNNDDTQIMIILKEKYNLTSGQCLILMDTKLSVLKKSSKASIEKELAALKVKLADVLEVMNNGIDNKIIRDILKIRDTYVKQIEKSYTFKSFRQYIGLLIVTDGYILIEDINELTKIRELENSRFKVSKFISFNRNNQYLDNEIYTTKKGSMNIVRTTELNTKYSACGTIIAKPGLYTGVITKGKYLVVQKGITSIDKEDSDAQSYYLEDDVCIITLDMKLKKIKLSELEYIDGKAKYPDRVFGIFNPYTNENGYSVIVILNDSKVHLIKYTDKLSKINIFNAANMTFIGAVNSDGTGNTVFIIDGKWLNFEFDDKILSSFQKLTYQEVGLNKVRYK